MFQIEFFSSLNLKLTRKSSLYICYLPFMQQVLRSSIGYKQFQFASFLKYIINRFFKSNMNYNISDFLNRGYNPGQIVPNKSFQTKVLLLFISTALKESLSLYEMQWKSSQISQIPIEPQSQPFNQEPEQILISDKKAEEKLSNKEQQNEKCIEQKSYNEPILPDNQNEHLPEQKSVVSHQNNLSDEHKEVRTTCQYPQSKRIKIIHQNLHKTHSHHRKLSSSQNQNFVDLYDPAYIPKDHFSEKQIREKRQKLLERRVQNWKEIDKKVGFRKMQLKKLLT